MEDARSATMQRILQQARTALRTNQPAAAVGQLQPLVRAEPGNAEGLELLGIAHTMLGDLPAARRTLENATLADPRRATAHYNYARLLAQLGELDLATEENQTALYLAPDHKGAVSLQQELAQRLRFRAYTSAAPGECGIGRAVVTPAPSSRFNNLECTSCGAMNHMTARACSRCGSMLPYETPVVTLE